MEENDPYRNPRQFSIASLLWATFWAALAFAAIWLPDKFLSWQFDVYRLRTGDALIVNGLMIASLVAVFSVCAGVGAMLKQHRRAIGFGLVMVAGVIMYYGLTWVIVLIRVR